MLIITELLKEPLKSKDSLKFIMISAKKTQRCQFLFAWVKDDREAARADLRDDPGPVAIKPDRVKGVGGSHSNLGSGVRQYGDKEQYDGATHFVKR